MEFGFNETNMANLFHVHLKFDSAHFSKKSNITDKILALWRARVDSVRFFCNCYVDGKMSLLR